MQSLLHLGAEKISILNAQARVGKSACTWDVEVGEPCDPEVAKDEG